MRKPATKLEKEHMRRVKNLCCVVCYESAYSCAAPGTYFLFKGKSDCHHICDTGRRIGHLWCLPLCKYHHTGRGGFSGLDRKAWDKSLKNQLKLHKLVCKVLGIRVPERKPSKIVGRNVR